MKLRIREWGSGRRIAVLVHGAMSDSRTWSQVGPLLAGCGYRVLAPDLRGHGLSPRGEYASGIWGDDLPESLPTGVELAVGHSLGGQALALAVDRVRPERAVYYEPAWRVGQDPGIVAAFRRRKGATAERVRAEHPTWPGDQVELELQVLQLWDVDTVAALTTTADYTPHLPVVPSLVHLARDSAMISAARAGELRSRGFAVRTMASTEHCAHRSDASAFLASLRGWV
jgi:pimeloyl-ACP methyl ester carboxylesterase